MIGNILRIAYDQVYDRRFVCSAKHRHQFECFRLDITTLNFKCFLTTIRNPYECSLEVVQLFCCTKLSSNASSSSLGTMCSMVKGSGERLAFVTSGIQLEEEESS